MKNKIVLVSVKSRKGRDLLVDFLCGLGLIKVKKDRPEALAVSVMRIFVQNKNRPLSYEYLLKKIPQSKRSRLVKTCQKLNQLGLLEKISYLPRGQRWHRAFKFTNFSYAVDLAKNRTNHLLSTFAQPGVSLHG